MSFNLASSLLCVSSDTETVHIFKLALGFVPAIDGNGDFTTLAVRESEPGNRERSGSVGYDDQLTMYLSSSANSYTSIYNTLIDSYCGGRRFTLEETSPEV
jgi:autophagy-related protein 18